MRESLCRIDFERGAGEHPVERLARSKPAIDRIGRGATDAINAVDDRRAGVGCELLERGGGVAAGEVEGPLLGRGGHRGRGAGDDGAAQGSDGEGRGDVG